MENNNKLILACQKGDYDECVQLINNDKELINEVDLCKRNALFYAIENQDLKLINFLIDQQINISHRDKDGYTVLNLAVICGNKQIVELLANQCADLTTIDNELHSLVHWSVVCGHCDILEYLINKGCNIETPDKHGAYPIHYASQMCGQIDVWDENINRNSENSIKVLKMLIDRKINIDVEDYDKRNAIIWAASSGSVEAIVELFNSGANANKYEKDGLTPLHCAASRGHYDCCEVLIDTCKCSINALDNNNCSPIFYAATLGHDDVCQLLIDRGANLAIQDCKARTVYHCAAAKGQYECLEALLNKNTSIWLRNDQGDYPIHEAYYNKNLECVYLMLMKMKSSKVLNAANYSDGRTLLHLAAADNDDELIEKMIAEGALVNKLMKTSAGTYLTPYDIAKLKNSNESLKILKKNGGKSGFVISYRAASKIQKKLRSYFERHKPELFKKSTQKQQESDILNVESINNYSEKFVVEPVKRDQSAQTLICSTKHKLILMSSSVEQSEQSDSSSNMEKKKHQSTTRKKKVSDTSVFESTEHQERKNLRKKESLKSNRSLSLKRRRAISNISIKSSKQNRDGESSSVNQSRSSSASNIENRKHSTQTKQNDVKPDEQKEVVMEKIENIQVTESKEIIKIRTVNSKKTSLKETLGSKERMNASNECQRQIKIIIRSEKYDGQKYSRTHLNNVISKDNKYSTLFEKHNLLLKSLYEIRRCRINNRNIIINSDLNNMLLKSYNFNIQKDCQSLKDLEKFIETLASEISNEFKRKQNTNKINLNKIQLAKPIQNGLRRNAYTSPNRYFEENKSLSFLKKTEEDMKNLDEQELKQKHDERNVKLKAAYKPLLPDDIYKKNYDRETKISLFRQISPRDKVIFLPIIKAPMAKKDLSATKT